MGTNWKADVKLYCPGGCPWWHSGGQEYVAADQSNISVVVKLVAVHFSSVQLFGLNNVHGIDKRVFLSGEFGYLAWKGA